MNSAALSPVRSHCPFLPRAAAFFGLLLLAIVLCSGSASAQLTLHCTSYKITLSRGIPYTSYWSQPVYINLNLQGISTGYQPYMYSPASSSSHIATYVGSFPASAAPVASVDIQWPHGQISTIPVTGYTNFKILDFCYRAEVDLDPMGCLTIYITTANCY